jgi:hypothetical protein
VNAGRISSAALMLSGVAAVVNPQGVADALHLDAGDARGVTETRAGLGGTYAALGGWALVSREPAADVAVGVTWLGAAAVRVATLKVDRPPVTTSYWIYLGLEVACGTVSIASAVTRRRAARRLRGGARPATRADTPSTLTPADTADHPGSQIVCIYPPESGSVADNVNASPG